MYTIGLAICLSVGCLFLQEQDVTLYETKEECFRVAEIAATELQRSFKDGVKVGYRCTLTTRSNI